MEDGMSWHQPLAVVTVVDVLESGACYSGVVEWILDNGRVISGPADKYNNEHILRAARLDGYGYGYGDGYGNGDGDGDGYGDGYGYGGQEDQ